MKITKIDATRMRNDEHFQFNSDFSILVNNFGVAALKIETQFAVYVPLFKD